MEVASPPQETSDDTDDGEDGAVGGIDAQPSVRLPMKTPQEALDVWNRALENQSLSCHHFRQWWRRRVPHITGPRPAMDYQFPHSHISAEDVAQQLIDPLERFMVNTEGDPKEVL